MKSKCFVNQFVFCGINFGCIFGFGSFLEIFEIQLHLFPVSVAGIHLDITILGFYIQLVAMRSFYKTQWEITCKY
jgi:hypothetical protein